MSLILSMLVVYGLVNKPTVEITITSVQNPRFIVEIGNTSDKVLSINKERHMWEIVITGRDGVGLTDQSYYWRNTSFVSFSHNCIALNPGDRLSFPLEAYYRDSKVTRWEEGWKATVRYQSSVPLAEWAEAPEMNFKKDLEEFLIIPATIVVSDTE